MSPPSSLRYRSTRGVATLALGAGLLGACGQASAASGVSMSCSGDDCRATVTGTPATVQETDADVRRKSGKRGSKTTTRSAETQFRVTGIAPGSVQVEGDDGPATVLVGRTFVGDDDVVRVESADGRVAVFSWHD